MTLEERLEKGELSQAEYDVLKQAEADKAVEDKAQAWMAKVEAAPMQVKKQMVKEQALNMQIQASLKEDQFEAKSMSKKAWNLRKSLRGSGGISFD